MPNANMRNSNSYVFNQNDMPLIGKRIYTEEWFDSDADFDQLYPLSIQAPARRHWTPLGIARLASGFLAADNSVRILDIGSGAGKFCLAAAYYRPGAFYYGVEQRKNLLSHADTARDSLRFRNVSFIHGNFTQLDFRNYDHFYFYNSFYENLAGTDKIDDSIDYSGELYNYYNRYLFKQLEKKPAGTKLVTYHSLGDEIPQNYHIVSSGADNLLKFWIKR
jgi:SAM-dependent methyltransferase